MKFKESFAGTLESGDILVRLLPSDKPGLTINLESTVAYQFGSQIKSVIKETLENPGIESAVVDDVTDKGELFDCTIRARVTAAAVRATGKDVWPIDINRDNNISKNLHKPYIISMERLRRTMMFVRE